MEVLRRNDSITELVNNDLVIEYDADFYDIVNERHVSVS